MRPVVHMEGIDHVIMEGVDADEELAEDALRAMGETGSLTPAESYF